MKRRGICYQCKYRQEAPRSVHSRCVHPSVANVVLSRLGELVSEWAATGVIDRRRWGLDMVRADGDDESHVLDPPFELRCDPHAVRNGWFFWPFNFDPVWLDECGGFFPADDA